MSDIKELLLKAVVVQEPEEAAAESLGEPVAWRYEFADPISGRRLWRYDARPWNGQSPKSSEPLYRHPPVSAEPVLVVHRNTAGQIVLRNADGSSFDMSQHIGESFYLAPPPAVPEGWIDAAKGAIEFCDNKWVAAFPATAEQHIRGLAKLLLAAATRRAIVRAAAAMGVGE